MPPAAVKTIRDLIFWQYSKIISESAGAGKKQYAFVMNRFKKLQGGEIEWSGSIREYVKERELPNQCIYCSATRDLSYDHLVPRNRGGPDVADNVVQACRRCNSSKGDKGVYEWFELDRRYEVPRVAEGKYLKLLYEVHSQRGTLGAGRRDIERLCEACQVGHLCAETALTVYCLESVLMRKA
ncbi:MAG: HNH endonuclease [Candidatus Rokubacteria bacterium]|nr:HNH endonuclease [Candidatus Rokubacteria bacterium]